MPLTDAAKTMVSELADLAKWEADLRRDLTATRNKIDKLTEGLTAVLDLLDRPDRQALQARITAIRLPMNRRRTAPVASQRVEALHAWLALREEPFTAAEVQQMLAAAGLTDGRHNASIILSRKVGQGVVRRVSRGWYEVNANHPEIAARKMIEGSMNLSSC